MKKRIVKIALGQFASIHGETQQNLNKMLTMTDQAAESGADLIVFPELAYSGYFCTSYQMQQCAEKQDGPFVQALREKAKDKSIHIIAGYPEAGDITGRLYNSCIFIDDDGNVIENMRKVYAWGKEKLVFAEGKRYPVVKTKFGNVGMLICYDIEYPEPSRIETLKGAEIIVDNTQDTIFGGFAPNSSSAETLSKALGSRTVMSGSVSRSKNDPSQSLQMIERPLLTPDELKSLPKGDFIVMKTGVHPMRVHLKLFFKWGIEFDDEHPYAVADQGNREVKYADKKEIQDGILEKYPPEWKEETPAPSSSDGGGQAQQDSQKNEPQRTPPKGEKRGGKPIRTSPPKKETAPDVTEAEIIKDLTETEVQSNEPS